MPIYVLSTTPNGQPEIAYTVVGDTQKQAIEMFKVQLQQAHPEVNLEQCHIDCRLQSQSIDV